MTAPVRVDLLNGTLPFKDFSLRSKRQRLFALTCGLGPFCHFDRREKSYPPSPKSFHSGLILSTRLFFFSRRHFLISFSRAKALFTSSVSSK
jgi:hypothetical protein